MGFSGANSKLAAIRERRGLSLEQISAATKINLFYLRAIEAGQIGKLPGEFYARSYIRQYARLIDYDEQELLSSNGLSQQEQESEPPPRDPIHWLLATVRDLAIHIGRARAAE